MDEDNQPKDAGDEAAGPDSVPGRDIDRRGAAEATAPPTTCPAERAAEGKAPPDAGDDTASVGEDDPIQELLRHFSLRG